MAKRTCVVCGARFAPTMATQRCCPPTEADRLRVKGQARSRCAKAYENARRRGTLDQLLARGARPGEPFDCAQCGRPCVPGSDVAAHATRFCGQACKRDWHDIHSLQRAPRSSNPREVRRLIRWTERLQTVTAADERAYRRALRADPCSYCGTAGNALDHIVPKADGGGDDWTNRTAACLLCNSTKGTLPLLSALLFVPVASEYHTLRRVLLG